MSDRDPEARIRELKKRVEREPGSRFFVPLAEEYRKAGRISDALSALEEGLVAHPAYVAARVALARGYLEAGRTEESMAAFSKALADDPSNLVAAKALGDLHLSRGEPLEALKRYRLYREISGDRRLDALIGKLQEEPGPAPEPAHAGEVPPPPFPSFRNTPLGTAPIPAELLPPFRPEPAVAAPRARHTDPHDISGITYERPALTFAPAEDPGVQSRDQSLDALHAAARDDAEIVTRKFRLPEATWPFEPTIRVEPVATSLNEPAPATDPLPAEEPGGRALADLYLEQGHVVEARSLYEDLLAAAPADEDLRRLRDEAAQRAAAESPPLPAGDPARERRLAKVRVLNEWLGAVKATAGTATDKLPE
jgi:tetratricopeptide (TPR) repeat protein